jgi:Sap, sulfolipid-1-addressing protein
MLWPSIGDVLPIAMAIALSPLAIVTIVVLSLGDNGPLKGTLFGMGWLITILFVTTVAFLVVDSTAQEYPSETADGVDILQLVLGLVFWVLAVLSWRSRARDGQPGKETRVLERVVRITPIGAFGLGLLQGVAVIKTIPLAVSAGSRLGESGLDGGEAVIALGVFSIIATAGILGPVVASAVGGERLAGPMVGFQQWLQDNMTAMTIVVLVVIGAALVGSGLAVLN